MYYKISFETIEGLYDASVWNKIKSKKCAFMLTVMDLLYLIEFVPPH